MDNQERCRVKMESFSNVLVGPSPIRDFKEILRNLFVDTRLYKLIYAGSLFGVAQECVTLACIIDQPEDAIKSHRDKEIFLKAYEHYMKMSQGSMSDHLILIKIFNSIYSIGTQADRVHIDEWFERNFVNKPVFRQAAVKKGIVMRKLFMLNMRSFDTAAQLSQTSKESLIKCAIAYSFLPLAFYSTYAIGEGTHPQLYSVERSSGHLVRSHYDLTRTITYSGIRFQPWANQEHIRTQVRAYHVLRRHNPASVDLATSARKINVVFHDTGVLYAGFHPAVYSFIRRRQLDLGIFKINSEDFDGVGRDLEQIDINGPQNPLELSFKSLLRTPMQEKIFSDGTSLCVNVLNRHYHVSQSRDMTSPKLLIGSRISALGEDKIVTKINTIYDDYPGQLELTLLLFGPEIKLYADEFITFDNLLNRFIANNSGNFTPHLSMGIKGFKVSGGPVDSEMIIVCNFEITFGDIQTILRWRSYLAKNPLGSIEGDELINLRSEILLLFNDTRTRIQNPISRDLLDITTAYEFGDIVALPM